VTKLLLSIHVLAAIIAIGPVAVAASMFPAALRQADSNTAEPATAHPAHREPATTHPAHREPATAHPAHREPATTRPADREPGTGRDPRDAAVLRNLHRICQVYAAVGIVVPVFGLATANSLGVLTDAWLLISIALTGAAAGVLVLLVLPGQRRALAGGPGSRRRLAMYTGVFNVLWAVVTVLMITRPGSTTGA
jgi:hypothetical protein